jgi:hypothetical protein
LKDKSNEKPTGKQEASRAHSENLKCYKLANEVERGSEGREGENEEGEEE